MHHRYLANSLFKLKVLQCFTEQYKKLYWCAPNVKLPSYQTHRSTRKYRFDNTIILNVSSNLASSTGHFQLFIEKLKVAWGRDYK